MPNARWPHGVNFLVGSWLFASPWMLNYVASPFAAAANAMIVGAAILLCALLALQYEEMEEVSKTTLALALWTLLTPWALRFTDYPLLAANTFGCACIVVLMSAWILVGETATLHGQKRQSAER